MEKFVTYSKTWNLLIAFCMLVGGCVQLRSCVGPGLCAFFLAFFLIATESIWCVSAHCSFRKFDTWDERLDTKEGYRVRGFMYIVLGILLSISHDIQYGCWTNVVLGVLLCIGGCMYVLSSMRMERSAWQLEKEPPVPAHTISVSSSLLKEESAIAS